MKKEKTLTAKEFIHYESMGCGPEEGQDEGDWWIEIMIAFAKYHVKKTLIAASEKAKLDFKRKDGDLFRGCVNRKSIIESYPLTNIK